jgi:hypothetical protein
LNKISDDPLTITTSLYINDLHFCGKRQALNVGGYFRQKWVDRRLIASTKEDEKDLVSSNFYFESFEEANYF